MTDTKRRRPFHTAGPAFPQHEFYEERVIGQIPGMSLRDYFAGQALVGIIACYATPDGLDRLPSPQEVAARAHEMADAMIAQRYVQQEVNAIEAEASDD
jgi:hypothetical protein